MTRAEIRVLAAKRRLDKESAALSRVYAASRAARIALNKKLWPREYAAEKRCRDALAAVTEAELAEYGIVPMQTIIECTPAFQKRRARYVVKIGREGWAKLLEVGIKGKILESRAEKQSPWRWSDARLTGEVLKS